MKRLFYLPILMLGIIIMASCNKESTNQEEEIEQDIFEAVDLGLSVKWASQNLGAKSKYGFGDYYAWGETRPKSAFKRDQYIFGKSVPGYTKYNDIDNKTQLDIEDDAARTILGKTWRIPTFSEIEELRNRCAWKWVEEITEQGSLVKGFEITGPSKKSIFIPMGEWDEDNQTHSQAYQSSNVEHYDLAVSLMAEDKDYSAVRGLYLETNRANVFWGVRWVGRQIRAVAD